MTDDQRDRPMESFMAVLVRQYVIGSFSLMHSGGGNPGPPSVAVELRSGEVVITDLPGTISTQWIGDGRRIRYSEIRTAQAVRNSRMYLATAPSPHGLPFGVRLHLGESRSHLILFTSAHEALLDALQSHQVRVERTPRRLGFMLIGRK